MFHMRVLLECLPVKQDQSVRNKAALSPYKVAVSRYIRSAMALKSKRYDDLVYELGQKGVQLTADNLRSKVSKGMFSADLLAAIIDVLEVEDVALIEILKLVKSESLKAS